MKLEKDIIIPCALQINPYVYLDIKFKFEFYIKLLNYFGGYMFMEHVYKFSNKSHIQTFRDIHSMKDANIIKIININKNNYIILTKTALKYLKNKPNVAQLRFPTFTQLKTCCYIAEYIKNPEDFFQLSKPYSWFLKKYKNEIEKYKSNDGSADIVFLNNFKDKVEIVKVQEIKSEKKEDLFYKLKSSKIYFDSVKDSSATVLILDFNRSKYWINKTILEKIEPVFKYIGIYKSYNIKILTSSNGRKERLEKDAADIKTFGKTIFLKDIKVINLNINKYFKAFKQRESFLKNEDITSIDKLRKKLKEG